MDGDAGANPVAGHASSVLSVIHSNEQSYEVIDSYGFYSTPRSDRNPLIKKTKVWIGLTYNLRETYGELRQENFRDLVSAGIKTMHFEISKADAQKYINNNQSRIAKEQARIKTYSAKMLPQDIIKAEKAREDRILERFRYEVPLYANGLFKPNYNTCKNDVFKMFTEELGISTDALKTLNYGVTGKDSIPIDSGNKLEPFRTFYNGPMEIHKSRKGDVLTFDWPKDKNNQQLIPSLDRSTGVYWIMPPKTIYDKAGKATLYCQQASLKRLDKAIEQLQKIEANLRKTYLLPMSKDQRASYYNALRDIFRQCQTITPQTPDKKVEALAFMAEQTVNGMHATLYNTPKIWGDQLMKFAKADATLTVGGASLKLLALSGISIASPALPFILIGIISTTCLCAIAKLIHVTSENKIDDKPVYTSPIMA